MKIKASGIQKIKYGEIHQFYPLKFESKKAWEELHKQIQKSRLLFTEEFKNKIMDSLGYSISQTVQKMQEDLSDESHVEIKMRDFDKYSKIKPDFSFSNDDIEMAIDDSGTSIKLEFYNREVEELEQQVSRLHREQELSSQIYGKTFVNYQDRFVLLPFKIELNNGESVWLNAALYIFANGMGFLKLEFPFRNVGIEALKENEPSSLIAKVENKWLNLCEGAETVLFRIAQTYLKTLAEDTKIEFCVYGNEVRYISLIDFDGMPRLIQNVSKEVQEDLFRIVAAPVPEEENRSYIKEAQEYIQKNSWCVHNINYVIKTTGGCLSYIDQALLDRVADQYKLKNGINSLDESDFWYLCNLVATDIFVNVAFALLITMLKKLNDCSCYHKKRGKFDDLSKIQKEYNENTIFISELQEDCYGTVSEQVDFFEKRMCHYFKQDLMQQKLVAIDSILKEEESRKREKFQDFLAIGGFLITLLFGLPALYDSIVLIRMVFSFCTYDVPILTLENFSFVLWILLNGVIFFRYCKRAEK